MENPGRERTAAYSQGRQVLPRPDRTAQALSRGERSYSKSAFKLKSSPSRVPRRIPPWSVSPSVEPQPRAMQADGFSNRSRPTSRSFARGSVLYPCEMVLDSRPRFGQRSEAGELFGSVPAQHPGSRKEHEGGETTATKGRPSQGVGEGAGGSKTKQYDAQ